MPEVNIFYSRRSKAVPAGEKHHLLSVTDSEAFQYVRVKAGGKTS
jgi:hypothetical protein